MTLDALFTTEEVAEELGTYSRLVLTFSEEHNIPRCTASKGRITLYSREAIETLRPFVEQWKNRTRITRRVKVTA